jgi:GAF domain-containing protein
MKRCLIIANQTLGGEGLDRAVRDCLSRDINQFYVIVPVTAVEHEAVGWTGGFAVGDAGWSGETTEQARAAMEANARRQEQALQEARRRAQSRLIQMIDKIHEAGGEAEGDLGPDDPTEAAKVALERRSFDEVIVSTLPAGLSRWLKMDLPSRVSRMTEARVTTVEAEA